MDHTITAIKVQKRNPNRLAIYLDGEFAFGLSRIVAAWLSIGRVVSDSEIDELKRKDSQEVAYQYGLSLLNYRPRSNAELRKRLGDKGYSEEIIEAILARMQENGLINDLTFAQTWVDNRTAFRPRSRRAMVLELHRKGVTDEIIEQALGETGNNEEELAYQAASRQARKLASLERNDFRLKLGAFLGRRGFSYETIRPVVQRLWQELHTPEDEV